MVYFMHHTLQLCICILGSYALSWSVLKRAVLSVFGKADLLFPSSFSLTSSVAKFYQITDKAGLS